MEDKIGEIIEKIPKDKKMFISLKFILEFFYIILKPIINGFLELINYGNKQKSNAKSINYYINFIIINILYIYNFILNFLKYKIYKKFIIG